MTIKDEILRKIDLRSLAEEAGAQFGHTGRSSKCPLPRHGGDRSGRNFSLYLDGDVWKWRCHSSCPADANGGNAIDFYMAWRGVDFNAALEELRDRAGVNGNGQGVTVGAAPARVFRDEGQVSEAWSRRALAFVEYAEGRLWSGIGGRALTYLRRERGLEDETIRLFRLGFNPFDVFDAGERWGGAGAKVWLPAGVVIPHFAEDGCVRFVNVRRALPGDALARHIGAVGRWEKTKFAGPRGGARGLFGSPWLKGCARLFLTEGEFDAMLAWQAVGDVADVATLGGARHHLTASDALRLLVAREIVLVYDADRAGEEGREALAALSGRMVAACPPAKDLTEFWRSGGDVRAWLLETDGGADNRITDGGGRDGA